MIENFNLTVAPGEKIGLVGRSGSGKSTLVNLALRLFDVQDGAIRIDGQDVRDVTQESAARRDRPRQPGHLAAPPLGPREHQVRPAARRPTRR